jgi:hypothetical protein
VAEQPLACSGCCTLPRRLAAQAAHKRGASMPWVSGGNAWNVNFDDGNSDNDDTSNTNRVRCVR